MERYSEALHHFEAAEEIFAARLYRGYTGDKPAIPGMNWGNLLGTQGLSSNHVELSFCKP